MKSFFCKKKLRKQIREIRGIRKKYKITLAEITIFFDDEVSFPVNNIGSVIPRSWARRIQPRGWRPQPTSVRRKPRGQRGPVVGRAQAERLRGLSQGGPVQVGPI